MYTRRNLEELVNKGIARPYEVAMVRVVDYIKENGDYMGRNEVIRVAVIIAKDWNLPAEETEQLKIVALNQWPGLGK